MSLISRLKERRFVQILVSYLAGGWIAVEFVNQLVERHRLPDFAYDLALLWYFAGMIMALLVGWYHGEKGKQRAPLLEVIALVVLVLATSGLTGTRVRRYLGARAATTAAEASRLDLRRVAVLYFQDLTPGTDLGAAADGFTEALIDELSAVKGLDVLSRGAVEPYRANESGPEQIGRTLEAGTLVAGTVDRAGAGIRVCVRLLDGEGGVEYQRTSFDIAEHDLLAARDTLAGRVAGMLREWLGEEVRLRGTRVGTANDAAWLLYQRAERARKKAEGALAADDVLAANVAFESADSLLAAAQRADPQWAEPGVLRGQVAYRRARVSEDPAALQRWVDAGLAHVAVVLERDPNEARALEVRGTLRYWRWLRSLEPDPARADALFREARADLERAVRADPALASAHATLSHLYLNAPDMPAAVLAARRAYEEDAYLENAEAVVWRLVTSTYNLEQFTEMARWCDTGRRRFPGDFRFVSCAIMLMTTPAATPDPPLAWQLLARMDSLAPAHQAQFEHVRAELSVAAILARAALTDSARAVIEHAHDAMTPEVDPERDLYRMEAYVLTFLQDYDRAIDLLKLDAALHPDAGYENLWWFRELRAHPRWREVVAAS